MRFSRAKWPRSAPRRARFQRKVQLAQICLAAGHEKVAQPILLELAAEIERRKLEDWEAADVLAHPLVLLYRCLAKLGASDEEKQQALRADLLSRSHAGALLLVIGMQSGARRRSHLWDDRGGMAAERARAGTKSRSTQSGCLDRLIDR